MPFAPGGVVDTSTRILTSKLTERHDWQFVVDNRPGGNGFIAVQIAARGAPDGYTLLSAHTGEFAVNPNVFKTVPYDFEKDFTSIIMVSDAPMLVVVNAQSPVNSLKDLVALSRAKPVSFGSPGTGSVNHLASEWLVSAAGMKALHVPYKGGAPAAAAVAGGEVTFTVAGLPGVLPHLQGKRLKVIGITTARRTPRTPDWPTAQEVGVPGVDASIWVGVFAPKVTYGASSHTFGWGEAYWETTIVFTNPDTTYILTSRDAYFSLDITDSASFAVGGLIPEFPTPLIPVIGAVAVFVMFARRKQKA